MRQNIACTELTMEEAPAAAQLVGRIREHTGDTHLPKVLVGTRLVPTNPVAVLAAARGAMVH